MTQTDRILAIFRSARVSMRRLSRELGHKNPSTVQGWRHRGEIPSGQQPLVLEAAERLGVPLKPTDFFDPEIVARFERPADEAPAHQPAA